MSEDPDVGILSCGEGRYCAEDKTSQLGGVCSTISTSRKLVASYASRYCNVTDSPYCNCSNFDKSIETGVITCFYPHLCGGCPEYCLMYNMTMMISHSNLTSLIQHYNFQSPSEVNVSYYYTDTNASCLYIIDGNECNFCNTTYFDCTNIPSGLKAPNTMWNHALSILNTFHTVYGNETCAPGNTSTMTPYGNASSIPSKGDGYSTPPKGNVASMTPAANLPSMPPHSSAPSSPPNGREPTTPPNSGTSTKSPNSTTNLKSGTRGQHKEVGIMSFSCFAGILIGKLLFGW